jgi:hypothetical protein
MTDLPTPSPDPSTVGDRVPADDLPQTLRILAQGEIHLEGEFLWGSNYTFLARVADATGERLAVYKPQQGERPLWDFPEGSLAARETAAWVTSRALGWDLVPPTVLREDGPLGAGSLQLFLDLDFDHHYFEFNSDERALLRPAAAFDVLINNADRKGGHILRGRDGHLWLIDHGVCFHEEDKLRTVIWDFAGEAIPDALLNDIERFEVELVADTQHRLGLSPLLTEQEIAGLSARARRMLQDRRYPTPGPDRPYPWPLV